MAEVFPTKDYERVIITTIDDEIHGIMTHPDIYFDMIAQGLEEWCKQHNVISIGMTLQFPNEETVLLFRLTWGM